MRFQESKGRLTSEPVLALPSKNEDFAVHGNSSQNSLGCRMIKNNCIKAYASRWLKFYK